MKFGFIHAYRQQFPVQRMCQVLGVSASGYYAWRTRPASRRERDNQQLLEKIQVIHQQSHCTYGSPRVHAELVALGFPCGRHRVARLMHQQGIRAKQAQRRVRTTWSGHRHPVAPNLLKRDFRAQRPNEKWVSDLTYIPTAEGWLFLAVVMDLFSRKIVGWAMDPHMADELTQQALTMALRQRKPRPALLHHSDQGSQYASTDYQALLQRHGLVASMSATGNCYDNAAMESFFATLKTELVHPRRYQTRAEARQDLFAYIEGFYNRQRRHSALNYQCPEEFERLYRGSLISLSTFLG